MIKTYLSILLLLALRIMVDNHDEENNESNDKNEVTLFCFHSSGIVP